MNALSLIRDCNVATVSSLSGLDCLDVLLAVIAEQLTQAKSMSVGEIYHFAESPNNWNFPDLNELSLGMSG